MPFVPVTAGARLSDQVAQQLAAEIRSGNLAQGAKLPTEAALVAQFKVSRTVVREAVSRLKSLGLVDSRQGSGVYVQARLPVAPLHFDVQQAASKEAVIAIVEVRRALEAEVAALAAERRRAVDLTAMRRALRELDRAIRAGADGVDQDVGFHRAIAVAGRNRYFIDTLNYLGQFLHGSTRVTRANEARRADFAAAVRREHVAIYDAIAAADPRAARRAANAHMTNAAARIEQADASFWDQEGLRLAQPLMARATPE